MTSQVDASDYEHAVVHPMAAYWLAANGYSYRHQMSLWSSFYYRCAMLDFLAWRPGEDHYLIVECKVTDAAAAYWHQLNRYAEKLAVPSTRLMVVPSESISEFRKEEIAKAGIRLLTLPMPIEKHAYDRYRSVSYGTVPKSHGEIRVLPRPCYRPPLTELLSRGGKEVKKVDLLTKREREVLRLVSDGLSNQQIASELGVEISTIKKHINHAYDTLGVSDRLEVTELARDLAS